MDNALQRCVRKVVRKTEACRENPDREAVAAAERRAALDRESLMRIEGAQPS